MKNKFIYLCFLALYGCTTESGNINKDLFEEGNYTLTPTGAFCTKTATLYEPIYNKQDSSVIDCTRVTYFLGGAIRYLRGDKERNKKKNTSKTQ